MSVHTMPDEVRYRRMETAELRSGFLLERLFAEGRITLRYTDLDRLVVGGAVPTSAPLTLEADETIGSSYFTERRELGILNVGGPGVVAVGGDEWEMAPRDGLYVGRGNPEIVLKSGDASEPARFYLVSYPAHATHPTAHVRYDDVDHVTLGSPEQSNYRTLSKYVHPNGAASCQLVMGITTLQEGSAWNTMPPHTHRRRTEVYFYFGLADDDVVVHLMGTPDETRSLIVRNEQAVLSPAWSIHAGAGTGPYTFCWAMGGENQEFADMQAAPLRTLR